MYLTDPLPIVESLPVVEFLPVSLLIVESLLVSLPIVESTWILGLFGALPEHIGEPAAIGDPVFMIGDLCCRFRVRLGFLSGRGGGRGGGWVLSVLEFWVL